MEWRSSAKPLFWHILIAECLASCALCLLLNVSLAIPERGKQNKAALFLFEI